MLCQRDAVFDFFFDSDVLGNSFAMPPLNPPSPHSELPPLPAEPRPGRYRHYKGNEYRVIGLARHTETEEPLVVYQALYGGRGLWVRPVAMWIETVIPKPGENPVPRFAFVAAE